MPHRTANPLSLSLWIGVIILLIGSLSGVTQLSVNLWSRSFLRQITKLEETSLTPAPLSHRMAQIWLAQKALNEDQPQQALSLLTSELHAHNPFAQRVVGQSYWLLEERESAIEAWVQAGDYVSLINSAQSIEIDYPEIALAAYQDAQTINPLLGTRPLVTFLKRLPDQSATAETVLNQAITVYPTASEHAIWQRMLAVSLAERSQWQQAEKIYHEILRNNPNDYFAWINLAWLQYETMGDVKSALSNLHKAISISPNNGFAYFTIGRLMTAEKQYDEADQWFQQAVDHNPVESNWWHTRVEAAISAGRYQHALDINQIAIVNIPGDTRLYLQQARIYQSLDDRDNALRSVLKTVSNGKLSTGQWLEVGLIYKWAGETQNALESFQQALILNPDNEQALYHMDTLKASGNE